MLNVVTHEADFYGLQCERCGEVIPTVRDKKGKLAVNPPGARVGVITTSFVEPSAYLIGDNDTNPICQPFSTEQP